jgi:hypothetical protein
METRPLKRLASLAVLAGFLLDYFSAGVARLVRQLDPRDIFSPGAETAHQEAFADLGLALMLFGFLGFVLLLQQRVKGVSA